MKKHDLASIFSQIEVASGALEEVAGAMLSTIKAANAGSLEQFDALVAAAYSANGWSQRIGRPAPGDKPAPDAVKFYVSTVRAGYRAGLDVLSFSTMQALRTATREARAVAVARPPQLRGVTLSSDRALTGALFHDVVVVWERLPAERQADLEKQIQRLIDRYAKGADLRVVA